ncbi:cyclase family protein [Candidatus Bathyarchaeota archaeon]|nr:cyclase family protein [Candidatus Bathyarchaeota archaeon]MBS7629313.1 cyclase family protein [Candidatus Bathyarchaeota archaeon]
MVVRLEASNIFSGWVMVDLTHALEEGTPGFHEFYHLPRMSRGMGDSYNAYLLQVFEHHGTHVDAPSHAGGGRSLDELDLNMCHGPCRVIDMHTKGLRETVSADDIQSWEETHGRIEVGEIAVIRYDWDRRWSVGARSGSDGGSNIFLKDFPGLSVEAAEHLACRGVRMVGADTPTIDSAPAFEEAHSKGDVEPCHAKLLVEYGIPVLEGLRNLDKLPPNGSYLLAFPLRIRGGSGSPVRAVALIPSR